MGGRARHEWRAGPTLRRARLCDAIKVSEDRGSANGESVSERGGGRAFGRGSHVRRRSTCAAAPWAHPSLCGRPRRRLCTRAPAA